MPGGTATPTEKWPTPRIVLDNAFVRGKGRLLAVKTSRPFDLEIKNGLIVLDGALADIDGTAADVSAAGPARLKLQRVTTYLSENLVRLRGVEKRTDAGGVGLVKTEVTATQCLFVPAAGSTPALVRTDRFDNREQVERSFAWTGKGNVYAYDKSKVVLEVNRPDAGEAMMLKPIDGDRWLEMSLEEGDPFLAATVRVRLAGGGPGEGVRVGPAGGLPGEDVRAGPAGGGGRERGRF